jgi:hypothetical protein
MRNVTGSRKTMTAQCRKYAFYFLTLTFCIMIAVCSSATSEGPVSLNEAVDSGRARIVQSRSAGGYSRFMIEMENLTNQPLSVDPYGSAFDPPSGVRTQRVGIGLPIRIGDQKINTRNRLSTDPSQEAPVGSAASQDDAHTIPDGALPAAAGAAAGAAAVGALLTGMAQGIRPREALTDLAGLIRGDEGVATGDVQAAADFDYQTGIIKSYREQDMTELDYQKQRLEAARQQGAQDVVLDAEASVRRLTRQIDAYDKNLAELGQRPLEHTEMEKRSFDYTRKDLAEEVRAELADQAAGTISDTDRMGIDLWIADNAPTEQAYEDMKGLVDKMVVQTKDGTVIGDKSSILKSLSAELQRSNQPRYTYFENYALREEVMDGAKESEGLVADLEGYKENYDDLKDTIDTVTGDPSERLGKIHKEQREAWEKDGRSPGAGAMDKVEKMKKIYDAGSTIHDDAKGYMAAGNSRTLAYTKAATQYGVDLGVSTLMDKNPAMKVVNTALKYAEPVVGKDITPGKGWRILTDKAFDSLTGELDHKDVEKLNFESTEVRDAVRDGQIKGLEERLSSSRLSDSERQEITDRLRELRNS